MSKTKLKFDKLAWQLEEISNSLAYYRKFLDKPSDKSNYDLIKNILCGDYDFNSLGFDNSDEILELTEFVIKILHKRYLTVCLELKKTLQKLEISEGMREVEND